MIELSFYTSIFEKDSACELLIRNKKLYRKSCISHFSLCLHPTQFHSVVSSGILLFPSTWASNLDPTPRAASLVPVLVSLLFPVNNPRPARPAPETIFAFPTLLTKFGN